jgi:hypothetical protein
MNFVPINGLRMLGVETGLLIGSTILAFLVLHFVRPSLRCPACLEVVLSRNLRAVLLVILVALVGRAMLLPWIGVPQPRINDEFSYLLMGDTFSHFRLTNPTPAAWRYFETFHVNLQPTYHSKYPVAPGVALAFGQLFFRQPWIGVYLVTALMCGAFCWALQAFVPPGWALLGALLATVRLAFFSYWVNSYWGGSMAALGGALALGAVVRLFDTAPSEHRRIWLATLFTIALLLLATSRPYEGFAFSVPSLAYFSYKLGKGLAHRDLRFRSTGMPVLVGGLAGLSMMAYYNLRTTGDPLLLPHLLNERVYSPLPLFLWQKTKPPLTFHDPVFAKFFEDTVNEYHFEGRRSPSELFGLETGRLLFNGFFYVGASLALPVLIGFLAAWRDARLRITAWAAVATGLGVALCIYSLPHYAAPATVTVYIFAAAGLRYLWSQGGAGERAFAVAVCLTVLVSSIARQTGSTTLNTRYNFPNNHFQIAQKLGSLAGKQLVLVTYDLAKHYPGDELVHNGAEFSSEKILWARSKGQDNDVALCNAYAERRFWTVKTDDSTYSLEPSDLCSGRVNGKP